MSSRSRALFTAASAAAAFSGLIAAVFLYLALTREYDLPIGHFVRGSVFAPLAAVFCLLGVLCAFLGALTVRRIRNAEIAEDTAPSTFPACLAAFLLTAHFVLSLPGMKRVTVLAALSTIGIALSAAYFFCAAFRVSEKHRSAAAFLSLLPILYAVFTLLSIYLDKTHAMNAAEELYLLLMYLSEALFFTAESRAVQKRTAAFTHVLYCLLCTVMTAAVGAARIVIALHDTVGFGFSLLSAAANFAIGLYALTRAFALRETADAPAAPEENADG